MARIKTKQLLSYLIQEHTSASVTVLMKLSYLIDLVSVKKEHKQVTDFEYTRYHFGPFDQSIYPILSELETEGVIKAESNYTPGGEEYVKYSINEEKVDVSLDQLTDKDCEIANQVLDQLSGYGAKALTEIAYQTVPMKKLGATLGGDEHLNEKLDLFCNG
jgi:DNA-binding PadR family transcriptional regulator